MKNYKYLISIIIIMGAPSILFSQDKWEEAKYPNGVTIYEMFITSKGSILAGTGNGTVRSTNRGESWHDVTSNGDTHMSTDFAETSENEIYAAGQEALFISKDDGSTWSWVLSCATRTIELDDQENLYITVADTNFLLFSSDKGINWKNIAPVLDSNSFISTFLVKGSQIVLSTYDTLYNSTDKGKTWSALPDTVCNLHLFNMIFRKGKFFACSRHDVFFVSLYESADGIEWNKIETKPDSIAFEWISYNRYGDEIFGWDRMRGLFISSDMGINWINYNQGIPTNAIIYEVSSGNDGYIYTETFDKKLFRRKMNTADFDEARENLSDEIICFPNPTSGHFQINLGGGLIQIKKIELYDLNGSCICDLDYSTASGLIASVSALGTPSGIYYLKIHLNEKCIFKPLIITNR